MIAAYQLRDVTTALWSVDCGVLSGPRGWLEEYRRAGAYERAEVLSLTFEDHQAEREGRKLAKRSIHSDE